MVNPIFSMINPTKTAGYLSPEERAKRLAALSYELVEDWPG
jgi:hypothetical protein